MRIVSSFFLASVCVLGVTAGLNVAATAATCPTGAGATTPQISISTPGSTCILTGSGSVSVPGYTVLDDTSNASGDPFEGVLNIDPNGTTGPGTFSIDPISGYNLVLVIKDGAIGTNTFQWGAFTLPGEPSGTTWTWDIIDFNNQGNLIHKALSHAVLLGQVPLPPALFLFGTALVGLAALGRRRRSAWKSA